MKSLCTNLHCIHVLYMYCTHVTIHQTLRVSEPHDSLQTATELECIPSSLPPLRYEWLDHSYYRTQGKDACACACACMYEVNRKAAHAGATVYISTRLPTTCTVHTHVHVQ